MKDLREFIDEKMNDALGEYYSMLEKENNCTYGGDISPLQALHWDKLIEEFADLFERLSMQNKME